MLKPFSVNHNYHKIATLLAINCPDFNAHTYMFFFLFVFFFSLLAKPLGISCVSDLKKLETSQDIVMFLETEIRGKQN